MKELAKQIEELYKKELEAATRCEQTESYKQWMSDILYQLNRNIENSRACIEDYKEQGILLNALEMEGHLRAYLEIKAYIEGTKQYYIED